MTPTSGSDDLAAGVLAGDRRALARAVTLVESTRDDDRAAAVVLVDAVLAATGGAVRVGISGPPGVGKSTFIEAFGCHLVDAGHRVVVTGSPGEAALTGPVAAGLALDLTGAVDLAGLAAVLEGAEVVVAPNTGPAHLAAAVGTPGVSLFAPVVPPERWAPYGVPVVLLGDQDAPCRLTRARHCPVPGHPCLDGVSPDAVVAAVATLRLTPPAGTSVPARTREVDHVS